MRLKLRPPPPTEISIRQLYLGMLDRGHLTREQVLDLAADQTLPLQVRPRATDDDRFHLKLFLACESFVRVGHPAIAVFQSVFDLSDEEFEEVYRAGAKH